MLIYIPGAKDGQSHLHNNDRDRCITNGMENPPCEWQNTGSWGEGDGRLYINIVKMKVVEIAVKKFLQVIVKMKVVEIALKKFLQIILN